MFLLPTVTLRVHTPVLSAQSAHYSELADIIRQCRIQCVQVHVVDKPVIISAVLHHVVAIPRTAVKEALLRRILVRETAVISRLQLKSVSNRILIVEFHLPCVTVHAHRAVLIRIIRRQRRIVIIHRRVLIIVVIVALPLVIAHDKIDEMPVGEAVAVVELAVEHIHAEASRIAAEHHIVVRRRADGTIMIRGLGQTVMPSLHHHTAERQVILLGGVPGQSGAREKVVSPVVRLAVIVLVCVRMRISLSAQCPTLAGTVAVAHVHVCVESRTVIIYIEARVRSSHSVGRSLYRTVIACLAVFLQHDIDNAGRAFCREFGRRVVYHLNAVDALGRQLLQNLGAVVGCQTARLTVYPHLNARISAQRHITVVVNLHRRDILQGLARRASGVGYLLVHAERLPVHLQLHLRTLPRHGHFTERMCIIGKIYHREILRFSLVGDNETALRGLISHERHIHVVTAIGQSDNIKVTRHIGNSTFQNLRLSFVHHRDINKFQRFVSAFRQHFSLNCTLCYCRYRSDNEQANCY